MKEKNVIRTLLTIALLSILAVSGVSASVARVIDIVNLELAPNPFSPHSTYYTANTGQGLSISFRVETLSRFFWLTVKVYNLEGHPVRTIIERSPDYADAGDKFGEEKIVVWWDGKNDAGQYARNGRYLVHIRVSDTEAETLSTEKLRTVVLVK